MCVSAQLCSCKARGFCDADFTTAAEYPMLDQTSQYVYAYTLHILQQRTNRSAHGALNTGTGSGTDEQVFSDTVFRDRDR